jgi:hypothetical protein
VVRKGINPNGSPVRDHPSGVVRGIIGRNHRKTVVRK